jgi:hypothetical protein
VAAQDFLAGMTDRYAVRLFEQLFIPKPWVETGRRSTDRPTDRLAAEWRGSRFAPRSHCA